MKGNLKIRLIGTLTLTVVVYTLCHFVLPPPHENKMLEKHTYATKWDHNHKNDLIFIGNSRIEQGVNTLPIAEKTGLRCYNFGIPLTTFKGEMYFDFLRDKLDLSTCPVIVVGLSPSTIMFNSAMGDVANESMSMFIESPGFDWYKEKYVYRYLSDFAPYDPRCLLYSALGRDYWYSSRIYHEDGWKQSYDYPMQEFKTTEMFKTAYTKRKVNQEQYNQFLAQIKKWIKEGITVIGFNCPTGGYLEEFERDLGQFDEADIARRFEKAGGQWIWIPDRTNFKSYDGSHLHYEGAQKLSAILADSIAVRLNCGNLP